MGQLIGKKMFTQYIDTDKFRKAMILCILHSCHMIYLIIGPTPPNRHDHIHLREKKNGWKSPAQ